MKLIVQFIFALIAVVSIFWLRYEPGFEPLVASLVALATVTGIAIDEQIRRRKAANAHLQQKLFALREIKSIVGNVPPDLGYKQLLVKLMEDSDFRGSLTRRLVRLFGLRNELIPYIDPEFNQLIDTQFQALYIIRTGSYTFREDRMEEFARVAVELRELTLSTEKVLMAEYDRRRKYIPA